MNRPIGIISVMTVLLVVQFHFAARACDTEGPRQYLNALETLNHLDEQVQMFNQQRLFQQGIDRIVAAYADARFVRQFHQTLIPLTSGQLLKMQQTFYDYLICKGLTQAQIKQRYQTLTQTAHHTLVQLQVYDQELQSNDYQSSLVRLQAYAVTLFGDPEKGGILKPYYEELRLFHQLKPMIRQASVYDLWDCYLSLSKANFERYTGIPLTPRCPTGGQQGNPDCVITSTADFGVLLSGKPGVSFPNNDQIPNRSILALKMLENNQESRAMHEWVSHYSHVITQFRSQAEQRFGITDWRKMPPRQHHMLWTLRYWAVTEYQRMLKRIKVINLAMDPTADGDWPLLLESTRRTLSHTSVKPVTGLNEADQK